MDAHLSYKEQLLHPLWKARRLEILRRDKYTCKQCQKSADEGLLHVHHRYYLDNKMAWEYDDIVLITLCDACHKIEEYKILLFANKIVELLRQRGAMSEQLEEMMYYLINFKNIETITHALHEYWRKNIIIDHLRKPIFGK